MKKILFALSAVALLFATSCKKESINPAVDVPEGSFLATIDNGANPQNAPRINDGMGTMTVIDTNRYVIWETGDQISINGSIYTTTSNPGSTVVFSGGNAPGLKYHAFYPASIAGEGAAGVLPDTQRIETGKVSNLPMYANSESNQLSFNNICAALKVNVPIACDRIVVSAHQPICGNFAIEYDEATPYADMTDAAASDTAITVVKDQSGSFAAAEIAYIAIPAGTYTNFTVKFYNGTSIVGQKTLASLPVEVNKVYNLNIPMELCFTAIEATDINMVKYVNSYFTETVPGIYLEYCKYDNVNKTYGPWTSFIEPNCSTTNDLKTLVPAATTVSLAAGDKVYFRAGDGTATDRTNTVLGLKASNGGYFAYHFFTSTGNVKVSGNIMYLLSKTPSATLPQGNGAFSYLFKEMTKLQSAEDLVLPATSLVPYCYYGLFYNCSTLTAVPTLPATAMDCGCYATMFYGCKSLTAAPVLPATNLAEKCYLDLFNGCTSLTEAPVLPATNLAPRCYCQMFYKCSSLTEAPTLPATALATNCYKSMFFSCTSLTAAPELPATTLADSCYMTMFRKCTSLTSVTMKATDVSSATNCLSDWLKDTGTGTKKVYIDDNVYDNRTGTCQTTYNTINTSLPSGWTIDKVANRPQ